MKNHTILHSTPVWLPQTQTWIYNQVQQLQELGVDAHVICQRTQNLDQFQVANIHCRADQSIWRKILDKGFRLAKLHKYWSFYIATGRDVDAQIVHSHFGHIGWRNLPAVRKLGAKHVVTFYGLDVNRMPTQHPVWRLRYEELFDEVDQILCEGSHMAKCIISLGCPAEKIKVQHLGVDVGNIAFVPRRWHPQGPVKILLAASFREKKGIPDAIEALGLLKKDIPFELTIIGDAGADAASQREKRRILDGLQRYNLIEKTRLLGYQPHHEMLQEAYQHHIFLSPSITAQDGDTEGGAPVTLIEMAATGMPIVSTTHCDIPEVIHHGITGLLAPEGDVNALCSHLMWLIKNYDRWEEMLMAGRQHIEKEYALSIQISKLALIYESLI